MKFKIRNLSSMSQGSLRNLIEITFTVLCLSVFLSKPAFCQADKKPKKILTTFTIIQDIAQNVAGQAAVVESITKPGAEIHDYEPTPLDIVKTQSADLVLWNGLGLERWFEKFFKNVKNIPSKVLTEGIEPIGIGEGPYQGRANPHSWMSPTNAIIYTENIRKALVELDPENAEIYNTNAKSYTDKLKSIDTFLKEKLSLIPLEKRWLVTCEGAFSYLARDYSIKELFLWPVNADEEGTPRQIQKVIDIIRLHKIPTCFSESTISDRAMRQVSNESGAKYSGVLYVDSLTEKSGVAPTYLELLNYNAETIIKAFLN
jgi:manganese/iron transport system substrate-binding protein